MNDLHTAKKLILFCALAIFSAATFFHTSTANAAAFESTLDISAESYLLYDLSAEKILLEENAQTQRYIASTTKLLTALILCETDPDLDDTLLVGDEIYAYLPVGSDCGLEIGQEVSTKDLLYGMLLPSGNDAANVVAVYVAGSIEEFSVVMNERAKQLGMDSSHFVTPSGYHDPEHYSTANDLLLLAIAAYQNTSIVTATHTQSYQMPANSSHPNGYTVFNSNLLLHPQKLEYSEESVVQTQEANPLYREDVIGLKTGSTPAALNCLVVCAQQGSRTLIGVLLKEESREKMFYDAYALLDYGFEETVYTDIGPILESLPISMKILTEYGEKEIPLNLMLPEDYEGFRLLSRQQYEDIRSGKSVQYTVTPIDGLTLPLSKGTVCATISMYIDGSWTVDAAASAADHITDLHLTVFDLIVLGIGVASLLLALCALFLPKKGASI